jgi:plasmid stabilization system protein ParE
MKVRFLTAALRELEEAADYYDKSGPGLGDGLYEEVEAALAFIVEFPEASPKTKRGARRRNLKRFPYYLIYRVKAGEIVIGAVGHGRREPIYWRNRNFDEM